MTPAELHQAIEQRRHALDWPLWRVAVRLGTDAYALSAMRHGHLSPGLRQRAETWLTVARVDDLPEKPDHLNA